MFKFGPFQLDGDAVKLTKNDQEISLEPQVFNTLLLLISNRHKVVTKEDLLHQIWQGRTVTDYVITRIIYELRKVLDDPESQQSHIRTVRGKGYQFIEAVIEVKPETKPKTPEPTKQKIWIKSGVLLSLLLVVALGLITWFFFPTKLTENNPVVTASTDRFPRVVVLPIEVAEDNDELSMLTQSLIDYLTNQLAISLNMKVIHPDSLVNLTNTENNIWAIQEATKSDYIIEGFLQTVSTNSVKIHLNLHKLSGSGELIPYALGGFEFPFPKSTKDLNNLYKLRKDTVQNIIKLIKPGVVIGDQGETETSDPEAYRLVITAHHLTRGDTCDNFPTAEKLLLKAVDRDPNFAYAYHRLFSNYFKRVWLCGEPSIYHDKALEMAAKVDQLAPGSYESIQVGRNTILVESNQVEKAYEFTQNANWDNAGALYRKVYGLRYAGFMLVASEHIDRILQLDPFFFSQKPIQQAPHTWLYQGKYQQYIELLAEPGNAYHDYYRGMTYLLTGATDDAQAILSSVVVSVPNDTFGHYAASLLKVIEGDMDGALEIAQSIIAIRSKQGHSDGEMTYKVVQLFALAGDLEAAIKYLNDTVDQGFFPFQYFTLDPALRPIQQDPRFTAIIEKAKARHLKFAERFNLEPET